MTDPQTLAALADIELPDAPAWPSPWLEIAVSAAAIVVIAVWVWRRLRARREASPLASPSPSREALVRLEALRSQWSAGRLNDREAAYRLCTLLRLGLGLPQLEATSPPSWMQTPRDWEATVALLRRARYRTEDCGIDERIFAQASGWLEAAEAIPHV